MRTGPGRRAGGGRTATGSTAVSDGTVGSDADGPEGRGGSAAPDSDETVGSSTGSEGTVALLAAVERVQQRPVDDLDEVALSDELHQIEQATRRLQARSTRLVAALVQRRAIRARDAGDGRAGTNATRRTQQELREELGWTPSQARQATEVGGRLGATPEVQAALDAGRLPVRHAALLAETLRFVEDEQVGADLERQLLAAAVTEDAVTFGRTCRRALATVDHRAAERADLRRHRRRSARTWQTEDGFYALSGQWSGIDGETVATAVHAFRRRDAADEDRTPQQVTADAVADMARAALRAGEAPTKHGVRPHVSVVIPWQAVLDGHGLAEASWSGPVPFHEVRRLLADCGVGRLLVDADGVPVEAGEAVRSVPAGLVRVLDQRDGECIGDGCHVPASWCEIMHLDIPYHLQGRLTVDTAGYGCAWHHDRFDRRGWRVTWIGRRPVLHHPDRPPRSDRARDRDRDPSVRSPAVVDRPPGGGARPERVRPATERPGATTGRRDGAREGRGTGRVQRVVGHRDRPMFDPMSDLVPADPPGDPP